MNIRILLLMPLILIIGCGSGPQPRQKKPGPTANNPSTKAATQGNLNPDDVKIPDAIKVCYFSCGVDPKTGKEHRQATVLYTESFFNKKREEDGRMVEPLMLITRIRDVYSRKYAGTDGDLVRAIGQAFMKRKFLTLPRREKINPADYAPGATARVLTLEMEGVSWIVDSRDLPESNQDPLTQRFYGCVGDFHAIVNLNPPIKTHVEVEGISDLDQLQKRDGKAKK